MSFPNINGGKCKKCHKWHDIIIDGKCVNCKEKERKKKEVIFG